MSTVLVTNFAAHSHDELLWMLWAGDVTSVRAAADGWRRVGRSLTEQADEVQAQLASFAPHWRGGAAEQYTTMMTEFVEGVDASAALIASIRDLAYSAADALERAQAEMPSPVAVTPLGDVAAVLSTGPSSSANSLWDSLTPDRQLLVAEELRQWGGATAAAQTSHQRAVEIMTELARHYLEIEDAFPGLPVSAEPPPVPTDTGAATAVATSLTTTGAPLPSLVASASPTALLVPAPTEDRQPVLFGDMFAAGSLAASAAVLGRFRLGSDWLERQRAAKEGKTTGATADTGAGDAPAATAPDLGTGSGAGGGGGSVGAGGAIGAPQLPAPAANPVLGGGVVGAGAAGVASAGLVSPGLGSVSGVASTAGAGGMGMMPPMMPPTGGEGAGMNRRIPPWLVETEPVFGEAVEVTPSVIGAEAEDGPRLRPRTLG